LDIRHTCTKFSSLFQLMFSDCGPSGFFNP